MLSSPAAPNDSFVKWDVFNCQAWRKSLVLFGNAKLKLTFLKLKLPANEGLFKHILVLSTLYLRLAVAKRASGSNLTLGARA